MHELFIFQVHCRDLVSALKKRPGVPMDYFLWHQDNASPHTAELTRLEINLIGFGTVSHPPYSPDLAPMDFSVFQTIKKQLKGRKFKSSGFEGCGKNDRESVQLAVVREHVWPVGTAPPPMHSAPWGVLWEEVKLCTYASEIRRNKWRRRRRRGTLAVLRDGEGY